MNRATLYAPQVDTIIRVLKSENSQVSYDDYVKLLDVYNAFSIVKPGTDDEIRHTWLEVERGPIDAFGDFEELKESGEVESRSEYEQLWEDYYPEKTKWYKFQTAAYRNEKFFYLGGELIARIGEEYSEQANHPYRWDLFGQFVDWLQDRISVEMDKLKDDPAKYNSYIRDNLPYINRVGKIKRAKLWNTLGDEANRIDRDLGEDIVSKLTHFVKSAGSTTPPFPNEMTADTFFGICEICYDVNNYFKDLKTTLSPRDKYLKMADGRDAGLTKIDGGSAEAFKQWYHSGATPGAHPWEICRGGNSTHISLYVFDQGSRWYLSLAGSSLARVEETVRMAVALYENGIPFELRDAEEIVRMVTGEDFIGIVPHNVYPVYCHGMFPKEDRIIDFMNLKYYDRSLVSQIIPGVVWYPLTPISRS